MRKLWPKSFIKLTSGCILNSTCDRASVFNILLITKKQPILKLKTWPKTTFRFSPISFHNTCPPSCHTIRKSKTVRIFL